ncbi:hypothetical protein KCU59_g23233, partial [Aureobasidium melanogenum]
MEAMTSQKAQLEREVADAKRALEDKTSADTQAEMLQKQIEDLKSELFEVQTDLSRERQSRDDVKKIAQSEYESLKREFDALNDSKVTIEKEMYAQSDVTRRTNEARAAAEKERKDYQSELQNLRKQFLDLQESKIEAEAAVERNVTRQANERQALLRRDLQNMERKVEDLEADKSKMAVEVQRLKDFISGNDSFRLHQDQHKERLE